MNNSYLPILALDIGRHRTGVAISESGLIATPLTVIETSLPHYQQVTTAIITLLKKHEVQTLVIGLPNTQDDQGTGQSQFVRHLIELLEKQLVEENLSATIQTINEFGTTQEAKRQFPDLDDNLGAATLILQEYLES